MQRLLEISMLCGTDYSKIYNYVSFNSVLDHSVGVALIIWNFTKDKKQTLSGLFHDIATQTFKHCIDFMNGDSEYQESTEERTEQIIKSSDYHIYPIADNDTPKLSTDRFKYTFSIGNFLHDAWDFDEVSRYYITIDDLYVLSEEDVINRIKNCNDTYIKDSFAKFQKATFVYGTEIY